MSTGSMLPCWAAEASCSLSQVDLRGGAESSSSPCPLTFDADPRAEGLLCEALERAERPTLAAFRRRWESRAARVSGVAGHEDPMPGMRWTGADRSRHHLMRLDLGGSRSRAGAENAASLVAVPRWQGSRTTSAAGVLFWRPGHQSLCIRTASIATSRPWSGPTRR